MPLWEFFERSESAGKRLCVTRLTGCVIIRDAAVEAAAATIKVREASKELEIGKLHRVLEACERWRG